MENPEEILHSLEEFSKMKPKDIPRELEEYLCYVAKTGNPVYQWQTIKSLFREKLLSVITEFTESCPAVDIPPCPNVELFNYELMKNFILEKLDTFSSAPFTVQRISELLTTPRKEYNRIDKYMRALEKNILVVSTTEPGNNRRSTENGESIVNGLESEHIRESGDNHDINVEEMDDSPTRVRAARVFSLLLENNENESQSKVEEEPISVIQENFENDAQEKADIPSSSAIVEAPEAQQETVITSHVEQDSEQAYIAIEADSLEAISNQAEALEDAQQVISETVSTLAGGDQGSNAEDAEAEESEIEACEEVKKNEPEDEGKEAEELVQQNESKEEIPTTVSCSNSIPDSVNETEADQLKSEDLFSGDPAVSESGLPEETEPTKRPQDEEVCSEAERDESEIVESTSEETKEEGESEESPEITSSEVRDTPEPIIAEEPSNVVGHSETEKTEDTSSSSAVSNSLENPSESPHETEVVLEAGEELKADELTTENEAKVLEIPSNNDIPMEIDIVNETEVTTKVMCDEPSSTSADVSL